MAVPDEPTPTGLTHNVFVVSLVSFFQDAASELLSFGEVSMRVRVGGV